MTDAAAAHGDQHAHEHPKVPYFLIAGLLFFFTVVTIKVADIDLGKLGNVISAMVIATFKASMVMLFFMHLKYERRIMVLIALAPFALAAILTLALFPDIVYPMRPKIVEVVQKAEKK